MDELTYKKLFRLWYPLAIAWIMISAEGPFLTAIVARLDFPSYNLAAYGISLSLSMLTESLVIMLLSTSTVFTTTRSNYYKVRTFTLIVVSIATLILIVLSMKPIFSKLATIMNLPEDVATLAKNSIAILIPWPAAIGFRRFYQGILIRNGKTNIIALTTIARILTITLVAFILMFFTKIPGAYIGSISLSTGVTFEAIFVRIFTNNSIKKIFQTSNDNKPVSLNEIFNFYYPLALTPIIGMSMHTIITFFLGRAKNPIESLATMPVVGTFSFLFASVCFAYMELVVANLDHKLKNFSKIRNFSLIIGIIVSLIYSTIVYSPIGNFYFLKVAGLTEHLLPFANIGSRILLLIPLYSAITSVQRGTLIFLKKTYFVSSASLLELIIIVISMLLLINYSELIGIAIGTLSLNFARLASISFLVTNVYRYYRKILYS